MGHIKVIYTHYRNMQDKIVTQLLKHPVLKYIIYGIKALMQASTH